MMYIITAIQELSVSHSPQARGSRDTLNRKRDMILTMKERRNPLIA